MPDHKLQVIAVRRAIDVLRRAEQQIPQWAGHCALDRGMEYGNDPRYTIGTTVETFPFPEGLTPNHSGGAITPAIRVPWRSRRRRGGSTQLRQATG